MGDRPGLVFLIGFMGAGKTTVGRHLARVLRWDFVDLDEQIVATEKRSIVEIFARDGEAYFRRLETQVLSSLLDHERVVVACGGGTYADPDSRRLIDRMGRTVWIQTPLKVALRRCAGDSGRPLLKDQVQAETLYQKRLPSYRAARIHIDTEGLSAEEVAERIAGRL